MKIDIIVVYVARYDRGHERHFVPPITGIHLAAITPQCHDVRVVHQQVEDVEVETDADLVALSFFSGFAPEAYRLARAFRRRGVRVVAGGPHATFAPDECQIFCDAVVTGEAESVWPQLLSDAERGELRPRYDGEAHELHGLPTPRYDLLPSTFFVPRVVQATRGCPFRCSFCTVPILNPGFRTRPVDEVLRDVRYDRFRHWWQRKVVWFWDDNLTANRPWVRQLLDGMVPLKRWWLTQASMDIARDDRLLDKMQASGCIGIFFGIESFGDESLEHANKRQNKTEQYAQRIQALHARGICVMAGLIAGFDGDTPTTIRAMAKQLYDIGVDVPFLSILTPFQGTPDYERFRASGRLLEDRGWEFYNGYNVAFVPNRMSPDELLEAHRALWREAFSIRYSIRRIWRAFFRLRWGAFLMCATMNAFYCIKALRGNLPRSFAGTRLYPEIEDELRSAARPSPHSTDPERDSPASPPATRAPASPTSRI